MSESATACDECDATIADGIAECPECGNNPAAAAKKSAYILIVVGIAISLTGVGAIIGVPAILIGIVVLLGIALGLADYSPAEYSFSEPF